MAMRAEVIAAFADRGAAVQTRHACFGTGFIEENELFDVNKASSQRIITASPDDIGT